MIRTDPIIAVKDVEASSKWYQTLLGCRGTHGGEKFEVLRAPDSSVLLCLHYWYGHGHPTLNDPRIQPGNGLILYFHAGNLKGIRENAEKLEAEIEEEIHMNTDSEREEFSLRDPDGYYLTISEHHDYEG